MCLARHRNWRFTNNERKSMRGGLRLDDGGFHGRARARTGAARRAKHARGDHEHARGQFGRAQGAAEFQPLGNRHAPGGPAATRTTDHGCPRPSGSRYSRQPIEPTAANIRAKDSAGTANGTAGAGKALGNPAQLPAPAAEAPRRTPPSSSITVALPPLSSSTGPTSAAAALPAASGLTDAEGATGTLGRSAACRSGRGCLPLSRSAPAAPSSSGATAPARRSPAAPQFDVFSAPEPAPAPPPQPRAAQPAAAPPSSRAPQAPIPKRPSPAIPGGVVSTGLRPSDRDRASAASLHR